jgi:hypothetical protein
VLIGSTILSHIPKQYINTHSRALRLKNGRIALAISNVRFILPPKLRICSDTTLIKQIKLLPSIFQRKHLLQHLPVTTQIHHIFHCSKVTCTRKITLAVILYMATKNSFVLPVAHKCTLPKLVTPTKPKTAERGAVHCKVYLTPLGKMPNPAPQLNDNSTCGQPGEKFARQIPS